MKLLIVTSLVYLTCIEVIAQRPLVNHTVPYSHNGNSNALPSSLHKHTSFRSGRESFPLPATPETEFELYNRINRAQTTVRPVRGRPGRRGSALAALRNEIKLIKEKELNQTDDEITGQEKPTYRQKSPRKNAIYDLKEMNKQSALAERQNDDPQNGELITDYTPPKGAGSLNAIRNIQMMNTQDNRPVSNIRILDAEEHFGVKCSFETKCAWEWEENGAQDDGFTITTASELHRLNITGLTPGPVADMLDDANGNFLYAKLFSFTHLVNITSPVFSATLETCTLEVWVHQGSLQNGIFRVVIEPTESHESSSIISEVAGDNLRKWQRKQFQIGRISRDFRVSLEVIPSIQKNARGHIALDNLRMADCFPQGTKNDKCSTTQLKCQSNKISVCIPLSRVCDLVVDCDDAADELLNCDKIPNGGVCDFENNENGWCGWHDPGKSMLTWSRHSGASPTQDTGPSYDHTFQNMSGHYMLVNMNQFVNDTEKKARTGFASNAIIYSRIFNPPPSVHGIPGHPYSNSCNVRFFFHQFGKNPGSINFSLVEIKEKENVTHTLWWSFKNQGSDWHRIEIAIPNITSRYFFIFEARRGLRIYSDVGVDDFSLSPECFGLNIPKQMLGEYNYYDVRTNTRSATQKDFETKPYWQLTPCGARGIVGPTMNQCEKSYKSSNNSHILKTVTIIEDQQSFKGMQKWKVPSEGIYTIIAKGASGGLGSAGVGSSRGAVTVSVMELRKNEELYFLVGQQGENACIKSFGSNEDCRQEDFTNPIIRHKSKIEQLKRAGIRNGAGGGGGASYVFLLNSVKKAVPMIVAGGGGGLGFGKYLDENFQHGRGIIENEEASFSGITIGELLNTRTPGGEGGGWRAGKDTALSPSNGAALLQGSRGGISCYSGNNENGSPTKLVGQGGFGGGGGGCDTGGAGGGYSGGNVYTNQTNGQGGTSYVNSLRVFKNNYLVDEGGNSGSGSFHIIPAIEGCGCDYLCVAMDEFRSHTKCICPDGWELKSGNKTACKPKQSLEDSLHYWMIFFAFISLFLLFALCFLVFILYQRYQRKKQAALRHKMLLEQDLQLSRLRHNLDDSALTNFNPNYGCDGILNGNIDVKSLPQVSRESLSLVIGLGQGAFGEVYKGLYRQRDGDAVEMPVAIKTLPELSTGQNEIEFLMEAAIMAKFNHPNIVHLIGVCFDRHPRFIVLELLAGGDLKNFLKGERLKGLYGLKMKDLLLAVIDVAKGCQYMESKRFIHRDIAARNCLLSSTDYARVVKIADFGMAKDIYRSDYYRKGGKTMLPIKWMPPEAYMDGIFTSKTDVWAFGVLLWEVFSLGLQPYPGLLNHEVIRMVPQGSRLEIPQDCPPTLYDLMQLCWKLDPEERPTFSYLLENLQACTQDESIMNAPLPKIILRPQSLDNDEERVRPSHSNEFPSLQATNSSDYLIPLSHQRITDPSLQGAENLAVYSNPVTTSPSIPTLTPPHQFIDQSHPYVRQNGDVKLISLDTPQATPTTVKPPMSFNQMDGITLSPSALSNAHYNKSYANIEVNDPSKCNGVIPTSKMNGHASSNSSPEMNGDVSYNLNKNNLNENYCNENNHSEISC